MKKRILLILLLMLIAVSLISCQSFEEKKQLTLNKQTAVGLLIKSLSEKLKTLNDAHVKLGVKAIEYSTVLREEKPDGVMDAMKNTKAKINLFALQKALAYKTIVNDEYRRTYDAYQELMGASKQLELDMIMLTSFDETNFDRLLDKLEDILENVQPMAHKLVIGDENIILPDLDSVWKEYVANYNAPSKH